MNRTRDSTRRRVVAAMLAAAFAGTAAGQAGADAQRERTGPADVPAVVHGGVRYEVVHWGKARGLGQNGGLVAAVDAASGRELWVVRVYAIDYTVDKEPDRLDVFITSMKLDRDRRRLVLTDENGRRFGLDLATRKVTPLQGAARR